MPFTFQRNSISSTIKNFGLIPVFLILYFVHFLFMYRYRFDLPYWDEWDMLVTELAQKSLPLEWIFQPHNEHRIILTKLQFWVSYHLTGLNFSSMQVFNFTLFGLLLVCLIYLQKATFGKKSTHAFLAFNLFLLSPLLRTNHTWSFLSQMHFSIIFFLLGVRLFFLYDKPSLKRQLLGLFALLISIFSFGSGVIYALSIFICFSLILIKKIVKKDTAHIWKDGLVSALIFVGFSILLWIGTFQRLAHHAEYVGPFSFRFWKAFLELLGYGFGFESEPLPGMIAFAIVLVTAVMSLGYLWKSNSIRDWLWFANFLGVLLSLAAIASARGTDWLGVVVANRYSELAVLLTPATAMLWLKVHRQVSRKKITTLALIGIWMFSFAGFSNDWRFSSHYRSSYEFKASGFKCIQRKVLSAETFCPSIYPRVLDSYLERARSLKVSFFERLNSEPGSF